MNHKPKCKTWNYNTSIRKHRKKIFVVLGYAEFSDTTPKVQSTEAKIDNLYFIKLWTSALQKTLLKKCKKKTKQYLQIIYLTKDLCSEYAQLCQISTIWKANKTMGKRFNHTLPNYLNKLVPPCSEWNTIQP